VPQDQIPHPLDSSRTWAEQRYPRDVAGERLAARLGVSLHPGPPHNLRFWAARRR
jgi:hypothetical protein